MAADLAMGRSRRTGALVVTVLLAVLALISVANYNLIASRGSIVAQAATRGADADADAAGLTTDVTHPVRLYPGAGDRNP